MFGGAHTVVYRNHIFLITMIIVIVDITNFFQSLISVCFLSSLFPIFVIIFDEWSTLDWLHFYMQCPLDFLGQCIVAREISHFYLWPILSGDQTKNKNKCDGVLTYHWHEHEQNMPIKNDLNFQNQQFVTYKDITGLTYCDVNGSRYRSLKLAMESDTLQSTGQTKKKWHPAKTTGTSLRHIVHVMIFLSTSYTNQSYVVLHSDS